MRSWRCVGAALAVVESALATMLTPIALQVSLRDVAAIQQCPLPGERVGIAVKAAGDERTHPGVLDIGACWRRDFTSPFTGCSPLVHRVMSRVALPLCSDLSSSSLLSRISWNSFPAYSASHSQAPVSLSLPVAHCSPSPLHILCSALIREKFSSRPLRPIASLPRHSGPRN